LATEAPTSLFLFPSSSRVLDLGRNVNLNFDFGFFNSPRPTFFPPDEKSSSRPPFLLLFPPSPPRPSKAPFCCRPPPSASSKFSQREWRERGNQLSSILAPLRSTPRHWLFFLVGPRIRSFFFFLVPAAAPNLVPFSVDRPYFYLFSFGSFFFFPSRPQTFSHGFSGVSHTYHSACTPALWPPFLDLVVSFEFATGHNDEERPSLLQLQDGFRFHLPSPPQSPNLRIWEDINVTPSPPPSTSQLQGGYHFVFSFLYFFPPLLIFCCLRKGLRPSSSSKRS